MCSNRLPPTFLNNGGWRTYRAYLPVRRTAPKVPCLLQEGIHPAARVHGFCRNKRKEECLLLKRLLRIVNHRFPQEFCRFQTKFLNRPF